MQDIKELSKKLRERPEFADFQEYVISKADELKRNDVVPEFTTLTREHAGEISQSRLLAAQMLEEILKPFIDFAEKHEYTEEEIKEAAARRGL